MGRKPTTDLSAHRAPASDSRIALRRKGELDESGQTPYPAGYAYGDSITCIIMNYQ